MKQRGRHRRRKRGQALRAFLAGTALALTAAATMISASQATVAANPGTLKPLTSKAETAPLRLKESLVPQRALDRLSAAMGRPVGVSAVLDTADRPLRDAIDCTAGERAALPVEPSATAAYCWDAADTRDWRAGAVTTSGDADDDGLWGANRVILSAWSRTGTPADGGGLARVAFVDANDLNRLTYSWVLLAVPVDDGRDFRGLVSQVSGMVWYQNKLLVTASGEDGDALYVYDMNRVQRATVDSGAVGRVRGGWSAHGAQWVLPAVGSYRLADDRGTTRPDYLSLDRSTAPDSLVASEWISGEDDTGARLWRYDFSGAPGRSGLLATDSGGHARVAEAYATKAAGSGPVLSYDSQWYLGRAAGTDGDHGTLWRQNTSGPAKATRCGTDETRSCWSGESESLSYWEQTGQVWSQSGRALFALPLASIDRSLG
ncbi:hypothetical protein M2164_002173 [Streptomyces sp. SAI-208]|jgi:hypothetical protein|uniref:hypothetical protein n=1 Tax=unclassified Streptomyces TaxID=2593676 RepID=UPI00247516CF|nr:MULTISPECIES: hypothetical protein [unclassified Streptomyces]MDH6515704.1 hypothetical protein [Streptomyces sp. SAI-090]MDH6547917.1 hypothetical protein [Streptomyces sp. SAI-041]MDH6567005.1 hypothetical protein [Streptomyces sp. SAI-117]MDH6606538.1 hypothetical protein [Streptomyces sp. SAI-208]MDH6620210.1 hypothetical protein [Streptomyces sp. SAI-135]